MNLTVPYNWGTSSQAGRTSASQGLCYGDGAYVKDRFTEYDSKASFNLLIAFLEFLSNGSHADPFKFQDIFKLSVR